MSYEGPGLHLSSRGQALPNRDHVGLEIWEFPVPDIPRNNVVGRCGRSQDVTVGMGGASAVIPLDAKGQ